MNIIENHWKSLKIIEHQWKPMKTMEIIENQWKSLKTILGVGGMGGAIEYKSEGKGGPGEPRGGRGSLRSDSLKFIVWKLSKWGRFALQSLYAQSSFGVPVGESGLRAGCRLALSQWTSSGCPVDVQWTSQWTPSGHVASAANPIFSW